MLLRIDEPGHAGPGRWALWALGFRPFYLLAGAYAALSVPLWALQFAGWLPGPVLHGPLWHAHEMLFGFTLAVVVGFLFTAGRNWSGQPTPTGRTLQCLALLWLLARVLAHSPWTSASMLANLAFPWAAAWFLGRALLAGGNRRNYFFVALLLLLGVASAVIHLWPASGSAALQLGLDLVLFIMSVMAGRVVPMFTNNGVAGAMATRVPLVERLALGSVLLLLATSALRVHGIELPAEPMALLAAAAALAHALRWWRWQPWTTVRNPLVWVLHLAYLWVPLHLALRGGQWLGWWPSGPAVHALTTGAIGLLTLAMMTRSARGHTARPLRADRADVASLWADRRWQPCCARVLPLVWPGRPGGRSVAGRAWPWSAGWANLRLALRTLAQCRARLDGQPG
jgi:uncharacterized protein involved in response to NO